MKRPYHVIYEWDADGKAKAYRYDSPTTRSKETLSPSQAGRLKNVTDLTKGDTLPSEIAGKDFGTNDVLKFDAFGEQWPAYLSGLNFNAIAWDDLDKSTKDAIHEACKKASPPNWIQGLWDDHLQPEDYIEESDDLLAQCIHDVEKSTNTRWGRMQDGSYGWGII